MNYSFQEERRSSEDEAGIEEIETPVLQLDEPNSKPRFDYLRISAGVVAGLAVVGIILFTLVDLSSLVLPMNERYLDILIPSVEDGTEPFSLVELSHEISNKTLSVIGVMANHSEEEVENVLAVITARETTGRFPATVMIPIDPDLIPPGSSGKFSMTVTLREKPYNYSIRFKLKNGPFIPHRDDRGFQFGIMPLQD